jgi:hypothetical protein
MTEVTNPYDKIARPSRHYDGVDHRALGGGIDTSTDIHEWRPVEGSNVIGVTSFGGEIGANTIGKQYAIIAGDADQSGRELFSIPGQDFTISFITNVGKSYSPTGWWLALCETRDCANPVLGLHQDGNVLFLKVGRDMTPIQLTGDADEGDVIVGGKPVSFYDYMEQGVHAWTLVAREGKLLLYVDGWRICTAAGDSGFSTRYPYPTYYVRVAKLPSDSQMGIGSIRYYNKPLDGDEIKRNFKVDRRRYAIPSISSKASHLCLIEREY